MLSSGIVQLLKLKEEADMMAHLGYPLYFLTILGVWKILGVVALLIPKFPLPGLPETPETFPSRRGHSY